MPLDRPLPDDAREGLKMLWDVAQDQQIDINRHRDSLHKVWHVPPAKPREGLLVYADGTDWNPGSGAGYYVYYAGAWHAMSGGGGGGGGYTTVQDEGVALTVRTALNFVGAGVTATDDGTRTVVTIPGGGTAPVTSVFTRTGAVVAVSGDYTAAQVTNAVSTLGSYPDPSWVPSYAYSKLTGVPATFTPAAHVHAAADVTSGVFAVARLGTGTPSATTYLRGDGAWTDLTWVTSSDARIKKNIRNLEGGLDVISQLRPISAEYNGMGGTVEGTPVVSFLAQELQEILPGAVGSRRGKLSPDDPEETDILNISLHEVVMQLVVAVKQLKQKVEALELAAATP